MVLLIEHLDLAKCPHCRIDRPSIRQVSATQTQNFTGAHQRFWKVYVCQRCGGLIMASSKTERGHVGEIFPRTVKLEEAIPERARIFLGQAIDTVHAPSGSIMLSASSVDAMLKAKNYREGSLYSRIDKAKDDHLITEEMAKWAHAVRLDANDQRHADENAELPNATDAQRCIDFAMALGQFLFVLPERVEKGLEEAKSTEEPAPST
jgi:DNA-directed RNA polymerase subunit RPC12/RpoP